MGDHLGWAKAAGLLANSFALGIPELITKYEVREALEALKKKTGVRRIELVVWAAAAVHKPVGRRYWEKMYISGTGKSSWKALTKFPESIKGMATELDRLCHSDYFGTEGAQRFTTLPSMLSDCADWIKLELEKIPMMRRRARHRTGSQWKLHLSDRMKALTGHSYDIEIARLINAVNVALNGEKASEKGIDAQSLADLRSRRKHRILKT